MTIGCMFLNCAVYGEVYLEMNTVQSVQLMDGVAGVICLGRWLPGFEPGRLRLAG